MDTLFQELLTFKQKTLSMDDYTKNFNEHTIVVSFKKPIV